MVLGSYGLCRPMGPMVLGSLSSLWSPGRVVVVLVVLVERRKEEGKEEKGERMASLYGCSYAKKVLIYQCNKNASVHIKLLHPVGYLLMISKNIY